MKIKKGDLVQVMTGKNRGKQGKVVKVLPETNRVIVEGVNILKKHERPTANNQQGGITEKEHPIHASNVMYVENGKPTRLGKLVNSNGPNERISRKSGNVVA
jgi:large subunit ribosomal protein L24